MSLPQSFLDQLRDRVTLSAFIQRSGVALKKAGREWKACCPFHDEKTPSFTVNDQKAFYHCFGCSAHGDVIRWLTDHERMEFIPAVKMLAEIAGLEMPERTPEQARQDDERGKLLSLNDHAALWFISNLATGEAGAGPAIEYLEGRGISIEQRKEFGIGWAPGTARDAPPAILSGLSGAPADMLAKLGLLRKHPDTGQAHDFFRRRVIIPIHDSQGRTIAFGGRIVGSGEPKYLNSPDTPVFDKGRTLFNVHRAAPPARANDRLFIVEGYMDVIGLWAAGIREAVAPNGTALTEDQLRMAWRLADTPFLFFDGDKAGRRAALRAVERAAPIMEPGKSLKFIFPPEGMDPDDMARQGGGESIDVAAEKAMSIADLVWHDLLEQHNSRDPDQRAQIVGKARQFCRSFKNIDLVRAYGQEFQSRIAQMEGRAPAAGRGQTRGERMPVQIAMKIAILLGLVRYREEAMRWMETVGLWQWPDLVRPVVDTLFDLTDDPLEPVSAEMWDRAFAGEDIRPVIEKMEADLPLRIGFLTEKDPATARKALADAIAAENRRMK